MNGWTQFNFLALDSFPNGIQSKVLLLVSRCPPNAPLDLSRILFYFFLGANMGTWERTR